MDVDPRRAGPADVVAVTDTLALAFHGDPAWSWVFPDPDRRTDQLRAVWGLLVRASLGHGWVWTTPDAGSVTQWVPPGVAELDAAGEAELVDLMGRLLGRDVWRAEALFERFGAAHPTGPDHYYLSLFGTHPDARGRGLGMGLLAANLALVDAAAAPAFLESTNPANLDRYRSVGFVDRDRFTLPDGGPEVTTMWREPVSPRGR